MMALTVPSRHAKPANAVTTRPSSTGAHAAVEAPGQKALYRVPEAMRLLSLSRSMIYQQIRLGPSAQRQGRQRPADSGRSDC